MKSVRGFVMLLASLTSGPLFAQGHAGVDIGAWGSRAIMASASSETGGVGIRMADASGFGVSVRFHGHGRLSTELAVFSVSSAATPRDADEEPGSLRVTPLTVTVHLHLASRGLISPWVGGGVAYVLSGELDTKGPDGPARIEVDDELTLVANAGLDLLVSPTFAVGLDTRYIPLKPGSRGTGRAGGAELELNPWIISIGARFRF